MFAPEVCVRAKNVDGRDKPGQDEEWNGPWRTTCDRRALQQERSLPPAFDPENLPPGSDPGVGVRGQPDLTELPSKARVSNLGSSSLKEKRIDG